MHLVIQALATPVLILLVVVVLGTIPASKRHASGSLRIAVVGEVVVRLVSLTAFILAVFWFIPRVERLFTEFEAETPILTQLSFTVPEALVGPNPGWLRYLAVIAIGLTAVVMDAIIYAREFRSDSANHRTFSKAITSATVILFSVGILVLALPLARLLHALS